MTGLRYSPLHLTEFCGEMQGKFKVGLARLISIIMFHINFFILLLNFLFLLCLPLLIGL